MDEAKGVKRKQDYERETSYGDLGRTFSDPVDIFGGGERRVEEEKRPRECVGVYR